MGIKSLRSLRSLRENLDHPAIVSFSRKGRKGGRNPKQTTLSLEYRWLRATENVEGKQKRKQKTIHPLRRFALYPASHWVVRPSEGTE